VPRKGCEAAPATVDVTPKSGGPLCGPFAAQGRSRRSCACLGRNACRVTAPAFQKISETRAVLCRSGLVPRKGCEAAPATVDVTPKSGGPLCGPFAAQGRSYRSCACLGRNACRVTAPAFQKISETRAVLCRSGLVPRKGCKAAPATVDVTPKSGGRLRPFRGTRPLPQVLCMPREKCLPSDSTRLPENLRNTRGPL